MRRFPGLNDEVYNALTEPRAPFFTENALWALSEGRLFTKEKIAQYGYERLLRTPRIGKQTASYIFTRLDLAFPQPVSEETPAMSEKVSVNVARTLDTLGREAKDKITGFKGTITSVGFDLYGCVQAWLTPSTDKDGKTQDGAWFDMKRLEVAKKAPVLAPPTFENVPGPEKKSAPPHA
jgi:hypothetical protein